MGKWDKYIATEEAPVSDKWSKYEATPDRSKFETEEFQGGATSPANLQAQEEQKKAESDASPLGFAKQHPFLSMLQGGPELVTGKSATQRVDEGATRTPFTPQQAEEYKKQWGQYPDKFNELSTPDRFKKVGAEAIDMATSPSNLLLPGITGAAEGIVGAGAKAVSSAGKVMAPFAESKAIQGELNALKGEVGLPKESTTGYISKTIADKEKQLMIDKKQQISDVKNYVSSKIDDIKMQKSDFDKNILNAKATDFAKYMKESGVNWARQGSQKYGEGIDKISSLIDDSTPITASDSANFFRNIVMKAEAQGINSPMLGYLKQLTNKYDELAVKGIDASVGEIPVNFGTLKNEISGVNKYLSSGLKSGKYIEGGDRLASMTKGDWLDFMGKYMPEEGVDAYSKLQQNYKKFADAKRNIGNMFHPYSGEFDLSAGINSAKKIALDNVNEGTQNLMNVLDKGIPDFVPGMTGFSERAQGLVKVGQEKKILEIFPGLIQKSGKLATDKIENTVADQMKQVTAWRKKYDELVEIQKRNQEAKEKILGVLGPLYRVGKKAVSF